MESASDDSVTVPVAPPTPTTIEVLLAPWRYLFRPGKAAACMVAARPAAFWLHFFLGNVLLAAVIWILLTWADTKILIRHPSEPSGDSGDATAIRFELQMNSPTDVWQHWASSGSLPEMLVALAFLPVVIAVLASLLAWFQLPVLHQGGSISSSIRSCFRVVTGASGALISLGLLDGLIIVQAAHVYRLWVATEGDLPWFFLSTLGAVATLGSITILLISIGAGIRTVQRKAADSGSTPHCEGCGYSLVYQSLSGRCSECGMAISESVVEGTRRSVTGWGVAQQDDQLLLSRP